MALHDKKELDEIRFKGFLCSNGLRYTYERGLILREIQEISQKNKHFSIDDIYRQIRSKGKLVSKGTLYRTARLLEDCKIVKKTDIKHSLYIYEKVGLFNIGHMVCLNCGNIIEIKQKTIKDIINHICKKAGFEIRSHTFEINGLCLDCAKSG